MEAARVGPSLACLVVVHEEVRLVAAHEVRLVEAHEARLAVAMHHGVELHVVETPVGRLADHEAGRSASRVLRRGVPR